MKVAWLAPKWDNLPDDMRFALLSKYYDSLRSIEQHAIEEWSELPNNFKQFIAKNRILL